MVAENCIPSAIGSDYLAYRLRCARRYAKKIVTTLDEVLNAFQHALLEQYPLQQYGPVSPLLELQR